VLVGVGVDKTEYVTPVVQMVSTVTAIDVAAVSVITLLLCPFTPDISKLIKDRLFLAHDGVGVEETVIRPIVQSS